MTYKGRLPEKPIRPNIAGRLGTLFTRVREPNGMSTSFLQLSINIEMSMKPIWTVSTLQ